MAAHKLTAIIQCLEMDDAPLITQLKAALELSCWTEDLDLDDYRKLVKLVTAKDPDGIVSPG